MKVNSELEEKKEGMAMENKKNEKKVQQLEEKLEELTIKDEKQARIWEDFKNTKAGAKTMTMEQKR